MADFIETSNTKTAVRDLTVELPDITTFNTVVQTVIDTNPFGCVDYVYNGATHAGVEKNRESHTAKVNYEDALADRVGAVSAKAPTVAAFNGAAAELMANLALATAMGGDAVRDAEHDTYSTQLKCHDASGEIYYVSFSRDKIRISSYEDDAIRTAVENWADTVPELA